LAFRRPSCVIGFEETFFSVSGVLSVVEGRPALSFNTASNAASFARVSTSVASVRHQGRLPLRATARRPMMRRVSHKSRSQQECSRSRTLPRQRRPQDHD